MHHRSPARFHVRGSSLWQEKDGKPDEKDSSLKIKIELNLEVELQLHVRVKGDITIGLL